MNGVANIGWGVYDAVTFIHFSMKNSEHCSKVMNHLSRIQGQIESLKRAIKKGESCNDVAPLTLSILRSFGSARAAIVEAFILQEVMNDEDLPAAKTKALSNILSLYKS